MKNARTVINEHGSKVLLDEVIPEMNFELASELNAEIAPCTEQEFFNAYAKRHRERTGKEWEPNREENAFEIVENEYGEQIHYNAAVSFMEPELREEIAYDLAPCSAQEFFDEYCKRHEAKFNETWELAKENPVY